MYMCVVHMLMLLQVGAAFRPNPGQCGLVEKTEDGMTFAEYVEDTIYVSMTLTSYQSTMYMCIVLVCTVIMYNIYINTEQRQI